MAEKSSQFTGSPKGGSTESRENTPPQSPKYHGLRPLHQPIESLRARALPCSVPVPAHVPGSQPSLPSPGPHPRLFPPGLRPRSLSPPRPLTQSPGINQNSGPPSLVFTPPSPEAKRETPEYTQTSPGLRPRPGSPGLRPRPQSSRSTLSPSERSAPTSSLRPRSPVNLSISSKSSPQPSCSRACCPQPSGLRVIGNVSKPLTRLSSRSAGLRPHPGNSSASGAPGLRPRPKGDQADAEVDLHPGNDPANPYSGLRPRRL